MGDFPVCTYVCTYVEYICTYVHTYVRIPQTETDKPEVSHKSSEIGPVPPPRPREGPPPGQSAAGESL